tara:strand:+ start:1361 stop:2938 length:1578 start_codon:yes stop_codon:yes gene_type:complete
MYNKLVLELLLHRNQYKEAIETFSTNIEYFRNEDDFLKMINKARDLRRFQDITRISKRWLKVNPRSVSAHKISFSNYIELADFSSADYHLKYLFEKYNEKNNKLYIDVEEILSRNIIIKHIVEYFEQNLRNFDNKDLLISYVNVLQKNNLDHVALPYLQEMDFLNNRILVRKYSDSLARLNQVDEAIITLEKYIKNLSITDRESSYELLALYLENKYENKASLLIDNLISIDPSDDGFMFRVALLCFDKEYYDLSEKYFNILLSKSYAPDNINFFLGQIDYYKEQYNEALLHYERIEQGTFVNTKLLNVAKALYKKYDIARAYSYLDEEVKVKTDDDVLNLLTLKLSLHQDPYDVDKILQISTEILESFPDNQRALYSRALAYEKKGDLKQMSIDFEKMINFDPYNSIALNAYGYSLSLHEKQLDYAEKLIRKAIDIDPGNPAILDSLAWVLYLEGSYEDAYEYASLAYIKDQDPEIVTHYYKILLKNGFEQKAKKILEQSLMKNPENDELLQLLDQNGDEAAQL